MSRRSSRAFGRASGAFAFSGYRYTEMMVELAPAKNAIQIGADPMVIVRPEGAWDEPGILETAGSDPATPPKVSGAGHISAAASSAWTPQVQASWRRWADASLL